VKRNVLLIGAAALVAIIALWYFVLYAPLGDDLTSAQAQTAAEQKKTDGLQADLARLQSQEKNGTQQQALLRKLNAAVPEQPDLAEFIIQANQIASDSGISFLSISPAPPAAGSGVSVVALTITIQGSFFQLEDYLRQLETLERLVIVDGITISASSGGSSTTGTSADSSTSSGGTDLSVTLTGRMFTRAAAAPADGSTGTTTPGDSTSTTTTPAGSTTPSTTPATSSPSTGGA
jgi:Tfp pilus assembly protein PilO